MVLWEADRLTVGEIAAKLILNTNTLTPLLKRMEAQGLIERQRSDTDERKVIVALTEQGKNLQTAAAQIPEQFVSGLLSNAMTLEDLKQLKDTLTILIDQLSKNEEQLP